MTQKRKQNKIRLTGRNALDTLNDLLEIFNLLLPEGEHLAPVKTPRDLYAIRQKIKTLCPQEATAAKPEKSAQKVEVVPVPVLQALTRIATNAWRARNKMLDSETGEAKEEMKRIYRHIEAVFNALQDIGIEIIDMQGRAYDTGMALRVITFEPRPGLNREEITETFKPTVTYGDRLLQVGEVVVGTPPSE